MIILSLYKCEMVVLYLVKVEISLVGQQISHLVSNHLKMQILSSTNMSSSKRRQQKFHINSSSISK